MSLSINQAWAENKVPVMPPGGEMPKERKVEQKVDGKKKTQAEMEQEMAALQYTNPMLLEVRGHTFSFLMFTPNVRRSSQPGFLLPLHCGGLGPNLAA